MIDAELTLRRGRASRRANLANYLNPADVETAAVRANAWIKDLRHAPVDGQPMRRRFTVGGESLWWFTELYLHKRQIVLAIFETRAALQNLIDREAPDHLRLERGSRVAALVASSVARARGVLFSGGSGRHERLSLAALEGRAAWLNATALASRLRPRARPAVRAGTLAAFVHRAFWRADAGDGSAEAYIGPVLQALEQHTGREGVTYVGVGPRANFRARRWWDPLRGDPLGAAIRVEAFAPLDRLATSRQLWRQRHDLLRAVLRSDDIRARSIVDGCDAWPLVREELAGVVLLQWPWSARVLDEAEAALDALQPSAVVTYAEAGGWGRALMLASRRRGIPSVGLQHGFIYRHWLNYLHEPDEMEPDPRCPSDAGFPRPAATLVFDRFAEQHLRTAGHFPSDSIVVTGSPRLDALVSAAAGVDLERASRELGLSAGPIVLLTTKYREARAVLPGLVEAIARIQDAQLVIKTHPAETPDVYRAVAQGRSRVVVVEARAPLAPLLRLCRVVVTVNSTVALDAAVLGIPALVIGLPNNLSPFVEAGAMAGASEEQIEPGLRRILYDEEFRERLEGTRRRVLGQFGIGSDGHAAERAASAVLDRALRVP
ncbi:MAG TPA: UDP-N-acetylglucosamine 2-epimerase [Vicinamibacterales bacterium]|nr:UDP-N-acetylglucosamine 2-epimerase [Vicinamibacterales bacterium]